MWGGVSKILDQEKAAWTSLSRIIYIQCSRNKLLNRFQLETATLGFISYLRTTSLNAPV